MKKLLLITAILTLGAGALRAQETYYALPRTSLTIQVEARQESYFAGPYASFAKSLLNMEVRSKDEVRTVITKARLIPTTEADPSAWYTTDTENANLLALSSQGLVSFADKQEGALQAWRFPTQESANFNKGLATDPEKPSIVIEYKEVLTDTGLVTMPIEQKILVEKTLEDRAQEAADMILSLRKERLNIITGNTDANFYGNSMEVAIRELDRTEKEYLALFEGYTVSKTFTGSFEVIPTPGATQRYLVFRLSEDGFATEGGGRGVPCYLNLEPETTQAEEETGNQRRGKTNPLRYRIPAVCKVTFTQDSKPLLSARVPVYQLGRESQYGK